MINRETSKYEESRKWNNLTGNYAVFQVVSKLFGERRSFKREKMLYYAECHNDIVGPRSACSR